MSKKYLIGGLGTLFVTIMILFIYHSLVSNSGETIGIWNEQGSIQVLWTPRYVSILEKLDKKYFEDEYFKQCADEKLQACMQDNLKVKLALNGTILEKISTLEKAAQSEIMNNCISDSVVSCSDLAIKNSLKKEPNPSSCDSYNDSVLKEDCYNQTYPKLAIYKDDISICNNLNDPFNRDTCFDYYNTEKSVQTKDITWCNRLSKDYLQENCKRNFYLAVAVKSNDINFCNKSERVQTCSEGYINQKIEPKSMADCKKIYDYSGYFENKQKTDNLYDQCLNKLFIKITEPSKLSTNKTEAIAICESFTNPVKKSACSELLNDITKRPDPLSDTGANTSSGSSN